MTMQPHLYTKAVRLQNVLATAVRAGWRSSNVAHPQISINAIGSGELQVQRFTSSSAIPLASWISSRKPTQRSQTPRGFPELPGNSNRKTLPNFPKNFPKNFPMYIPEQTITDADRLMDSFTMKFRKVFSGKAEAARPTTQPLTREIHALDLKIIESTKSQQRPTTRTQHSLPPAAQISEQSTQNADEMLRQWGKSVRQTFSRSKSHKDLYGTSTAVQPDKKM